MLSLSLRFDNIVSGCVEVYIYIYIYIYILFIEIYFKLIITMSLYETDASSS